MNLGDFRTCIDKLPTESVVCFAGMGEPWLNPDCTEMLLYAHNRGHKVTVLTTLAGMQLSDLKLLETIPFGSFQVHLPADPPQENIPTNDQYFRILDKLSKSNINATFHCHGKQTHPAVKSILNTNDKTFEYRALYQRSGNIKIPGRFNKARKRGAIKCIRHQKNNVLLPNGDVLLCSNDYAMKHILGNLITSSYESLFSGSEFEKVANGMMDESSDIICRYCDNFSRDISISTYIQNFDYRLDHYIYYLKDIRNFRDLKIIIRKIIS